MSELKSHPRCYFCGGKSCKYEDYSRWVHKKDNHNALEGVYSNWVTDRIVACARYKARDVQKYGIVEQFTKFDIGAIINLQERGEHPHCGDGNLKSGFSYDPEVFMAAGVHFYHMGWPDLGVPTFERMVDIVQIMSFILANRTRIAVHCHAGLGRTGLTIACFLVFEYNIDPAQAIIDVRLHRKRAIQNKKQQNFIHVFHQKLNELRMTFAPSFSRFTLEDYLIRQRRYLHGEDVIHFRFIPKVIHMLIERIQEISEKTNADSIMYQMIETNYSIEELNRIQTIKDEINAGMLKNFSGETSIKILTKLIVFWFSHLEEPLIPTSIIESLHSEGENLNTEKLNEMPEFRRRTLLLITQFVKKFLVTSSRISQIFLNRMALSIFGPKKEDPYVSDISSGDESPEENKLGSILGKIIQIWKPTEFSPKIFYPLNTVQAQLFTEMMEKSRNELGIKVSSEEPDSEETQDDSGEEGDNTAAQKEEQASASECKETLEPPKSDNQPALSTATAQTEILSGKDEQSDSHTQVGISASSALPFTMNYL